MPAPPTVRPSVFIGSSSEGRAAAESLQVLLDHECEVEPWSQGVFGLMQGTLESLMLALSRFDFAILVLTADDLLESRGVQRAVARDNVIFELGLFIGALGRDRTFMVFDRTNPPALPSDLAGITAATYAPHARGNLPAALGAASVLILNSVRRLGVRESQAAKHLSQASSTIEHAGAQMQDLIRLIARSRKVELDIISAQFGPLIHPTKLAEMRQDLADLESTLSGVLRTEVT